MQSSADHTEVKTVFPSFSFCNDQDIDIFINMEPYQKGKLIAATGKLIHYPYLKE